MFETQPLMPSPEPSKKKKPDTFKKLETMFTPPPPPLSKDKEYALGSGEGPGGDDIFSLYKIFNAIAKYYPLETFSQDVAEKHKGDNENYYAKTLKTFLELLKTEGNNFKQTILRIYEKAQQEIDLTKDLSPEEILALEAYIMESELKTKSNRNPSEQKFPNDKPPMLTEL